MYALEKRVKMDIAVGMSKGDRGMKKEDKEQALSLLDAIESLVPSIDIAMYVGGVRDIINKYDDCISKDEVRKMLEEAFKSKTNIDILISESKNKYEYEHLRLQHISYESQIRLLNRILEEE